MRTALLITAAVFALGSGVLAIQPWYAMGGRFAPEFLIAAAVPGAIAVGLVIVTVWL